ncbi:MAG TPA: UDP-glucose/GDP-mannose dehydrogenase family protein [Stellaceae bacterium]|jgi:GDP-mannose 6-dehydrogenase|nr:UDP-glucose/GDP-mannose dehydrogenase family protein [Stellaceae bacterium]
MNISVFGIGYVGTVVAACMADDGHRVVAVDIATDKVDAINAGQSPIVEPGLAELIARAVEQRRLWATNDVAAAIADSELSFICVGTPSLPNGSLDLKFVVQIAADIGKALRGKRDRHMVVVRSTILPGAMEKSIVPVLREHSGKEPGTDFGLGYYPEFLRESSAIEDFRNPATAVIGAMDEPTAAALKSLNADNGAAIHVTDCRTAASIKYANNVWHALKVSFANEIGAICKASGIDGNTVMEILCSDKRLNISPAYLKPGFAFGGSCLPKDLRALRYHAKMVDAQSLILDATVDVNQLQIERAIAMIAATGKKNVTMLGLTFKPDTDDLRESPLVELAERLLGKGYKLTIYDRDLQIARLVGSNRRFAMQHLPHLSDHLENDLYAALRAGDVVVVGTGHKAFKDLRAKLDPDHCVIDLVGRDRDLRRHPHYEGAGW